VEPDRAQAAGRGVAVETLTTAGGVELTIGPAGAEDHDELFELYARVVEEGGAFPREPPAEWATFQEAWLDRKTAVVVARRRGELAGSYFLEPNYPGLAAHIGNAGYMVAPPLRRRGVGGLLVEHSLEQARRHGFDALMFNLVQESNPSRAIYERLGFEVVGRVPHAVRGNAALIYWRAL
jgi:GNAT superfamily N-acetyltransferase